MSAELSRGEIRTAFIAKARAAIRAGQSASAFITRMKVEGLTYRRTDMLSDWRGVGDIEKKTGLLRYVRKDYYPTRASIAELPWNLSAEFMYKVRVQSRIAPDEPITERFVNIMSDKPLTMGQVEQQTFTMFDVREEYVTEELVAVTPFTAVQRVME